MKVDLDKKDLIHLVKGVQPAYKVMNKLHNYGEYNDNRGWQWNFYKLNQLTEERLFEIYELCKKSWE